jgi:hypothetical protein
MHPNFDARRRQPHAPTDAPELPIGLVAGARIAT